eukprot:gnl/Chilomastix_caulleri/3998.p1 GENE.gnl/Chilomastix_caulleri/3998~~gnl/Chilomastix_caulleri/3998.p1  ORF type:complete len:117 (+),score=28.64 gnl/Chilomastix_caulleri/3998:77-427(+)
MMTMKEIGCIGILRQIVLETIGISQQWKNDMFPNLESATSLDINQSVIDYETTRRNWIEKCDGIIGIVTNKCLEKFRALTEKYSKFDWKAFWGNEYKLIAECVLLVVMSRERSNVL